MVLVHKRYINYDPPQKKTQLISENFILLHFYIERMENVR